MYVPVLNGRQADAVGPDTDTALRKQDTVVETLDELADRRAQAAQAIPIGAGVSQYKTVEFAERPPNGNGENLGPIVVSRTNGHVPPESPVHGVMPSAWGPPAPASQESPPTRCRLCPSLELYRLKDGRWRCDGCGEVATPTGVLNGRIAMHDRGDGVSEGYIGPAPGYEAIDTELWGRRDCCKTEGLVRRRGGLWRCDGCGGSGAAS